MIKWANTFKAPNTARDFYQIVINYQLHNLFHEVIQILSFFKDYLEWQQPSETLTMQESPWLLSPVYVITDW